VESLLDLAVDGQGEDLGAAVAEHHPVILGSVHLGRGRTRDS
jgi:hypothetical protein